METTAQAVRRIPIFSDLPDEEVNRLAAVVIRRTYRAGEIVVFEGDPCQAVYFVVAGRVHIYRLSPTGRRQILAQLGPGQAFNAAASLRPNSTNQATAEATIPLTLYAIPRDDFHRLLNECPALTLALLRDFSARLGHLTDLVADLSLRTVRGRLARFLLENAETDTATSRWTQDEIAAYVGTVRDMVGRTLRSFADAGLVRMERQRIVLLDREGLEAEAR